MLKSRRSAPTNEAELMDSGLCQCLLTHVNGNTAVQQISSSIQD